MVIDVLKKMRYWNFLFQVYQFLLLHFEALLLCVRIAVIIISDGLSFYYNNVPFFVFCDNLLRAMMILMRSQQVFYENS